MFDKRKKTFNIEKSSATLACHVFVAMKKSRYSILDKMAPGKKCRSVDRPDEKVLQMVFEKCRIGLFEESLDTSCVKSFKIFPMQGTRQKKKHFGKTFL